MLPQGRVTVLQGAQGDLGVVDRDFREQHLGPIGLTRVEHLLVGPQGFFGVGEKAVVQVDHAL